MAQPGESIQVVGANVPDKAQAGEIYLADVQNAKDIMPIREAFEVYANAKRSGAYGAIHASYPAHYVLTLANAQTEPFLPTIQRQQSPDETVQQVSGRILDFFVVDQQEQTNASDDTGLYEYAFADTAFVQSEYVLRQKVAEAKKANKVSMYERLLEEDADIFCVWEVGKTAVSKTVDLTLVSVVNSNEVGNSDTLEIVGELQLPGFDKEIKKAGAFTYNYHAGFTDALSYDSNQLKAFRELQEGVRNPNSKTALKFLEAITATLMGEQNALKKVGLRGKADQLDKMVDLILMFDNSDIPYAHDIIRANMLMKIIGKEEAEGRIPLDGEPTFKERRAKVWYELAHAYAYSCRLHELQEEHRQATYVAVRDLQLQSNPQTGEMPQPPVFQPVRLEFMSHDTVDAGIAHAAADAMKKLHSESRLRPLLQKLIHRNQGLERQLNHTFSIKAGEGCGVQILQNVHSAAKIDPAPRGMAGFTSSPRGSLYPVMIQQPYYRQELANNFTSGDAESFINKIPGIVARVKLLIPEIDQHVDVNYDANTDKVPRQFVVTSVRHQPYVISRPLLEKLFGGQKEHDALRTKLKERSIRWSEIVNAPRVQSWVLLGKEPIDHKKPRGMQELRVIDKPYHNGDSLMLFHHTHKQYKGVNFARGRIPGQRPMRRTNSPRRVTIERRTGLKNPIYSKQIHSIASSALQKQLEVVFADGMVMVHDAFGKNSSGETVRTFIPARTKRVVVATRRGAKEV